ncbi:hypothetical protein ACRAWF_00275 [Streptomyces sp. L7]
MTRRTPSWTCTSPTPSTRGPGAKGATGLTHDWNVSAELVRRSPKPLMMAGGLARPGERRRRDPRRPARRRRRAHRPGGPRRSQGPGEGREVPGGGPARLRRDRLTGPKPGRP